MKFNISHILSPNFTKYIPLNLASRDLSKNTKGASQFLLNFQLGFNWIEFFQWKSHSIIKNFYATSPNTMKPSWCTLLAQSFPKIWGTQSKASSLRAFQIYEEHNLKHPSLVDLIVTKQNKLSCFIDWCYDMCFHISYIKLTINCIKNTHWCFLEIKFDIFEVVIIYLVRFSQIWLIVKYENKKTKHLYFLLVNYLKMYRNLVGFFFSNWFFFKFFKLKKIIEFFTKFCKVLE